MTNVNFEIVGWGIWSKCKPSTDYLDENNADKHDDDNVQDVDDDNNEQVEDERSKYGPIPVSEKAQVNVIIIIIITKAQL